MDIDNIPFGVDFRDHIRENVRSADILLAIVGTSWIGSNAEGAPRILQADDPVRAEVEIAFEHAQAVAAFLAGADDVGHLPLDRVEPRGDCVDQVAGRGRRIGEAGGVVTTREAGPVSHRALRILVDQQGLHSATRERGGEIYCGGGFASSSLLAYYGEDSAHLC